MLLFHFRLAIQRAACHRVGSLSQLKYGDIMKKLILILLIGLGVYGYLEQPDQVSPVARSSFSTDAGSDKSFRDAYDNRQSDLQLGGSGKVIKILHDDLKGSRHQKFILKLASGQTLLVAHNIDLAEKIRGLSVDDQVEFYGEYEWDAKGGVIHWTHHDPNGRHEDGWLLHKGRTYQ